MAEKLRQERLQLQAFSPAHVMPVIRQHDLSSDTGAAALLKEKMRGFPFVLVLPRGEEDLEGAPRAGFDAVSSPLPA